jgi:16S rRNA (uracil1498-N3)-methyltransferase
VERPVLELDDRHHLERVLRLRPADVVTVADGRGAWRRCTLGTGGVLALVGEVVHQPRPAPAITIAFAVTKGERPELAVQKLTELGVDRIVAFPAERSVARWEGERAVRHVERLRRVAREAAVQSRRSWLPDVAPLTTLAAILGEPGAVVADPQGGRPSLTSPTIVVGPEGGFSDRERALARGAVRLGPHVLRAETAAITAGAVLAALRDGLVDQA